MALLSADRFTRRGFMASLGAASASASASLRSGSVKHPNVLVFMTDQQSALLPGSVRRPAYESMRQRGVEFTHAFCNTPQCSPARSSLLTGLEPHHSGMLTNVDALSLGMPLAATKPTVGTVFRNEGYRTGYFGKWHLGSEPGRQDHGALRQFGFNEYEGGGDNAVAEAAAAWIRDQSEPWLGWVSILNPHNIYSIVERLQSISVRAGVQPPLTARKDIGGKPAAQARYLYHDQGQPTVQYDTTDWLRYRTLYCELVEKADRCFATVLNSVKDLDNTIVVFTSDHGDALGEHGLPFKGPFLYEPLIRIPLLIAGPGLGKNVKRDDFVISADLAPTLAGLAGIRWPGAIDGKDLSGGSTGRGAVFLEYYGKQHWVCPIRTIRTRSWKLSRYATGESELYDLRNDYKEEKNLAGEKQVAAIQKELEERLSHWWPGESLLQS